jgi:hypothetical protein
MAIRSYSGTTGIPPGPSAERIHASPRGRATLGTGPARTPEHGACDRDTATILAIDLGKFKSVACVYRRRGGGTPAFHTLASTRAALTGLLDAVAPAVVVIAACALAGWVHDLCADLRLACKVANTAASPHVWAVVSAVRASVMPASPPDARPRPDRLGPSFPEPHCAGMAAVEPAEGSLVTRSSPRAGEAIIGDSPEPPASRRRKQSARTG